MALIVAEWRDYGYLQVSKDEICTSAAYVLFYKLRGFDASKE
jgi:hypothetical protein